MDLLFGTIMENGLLTGSSFFIATAVSLLIGAFLAYLYTRRNSSSRSFLLTLILLPAVVQLVIMMVNGNIGAGVAVAGAFSLVRFRSAAGSGQEITTIFLAMACGLATGMGYIGAAVLFALILGLVSYFIQGSSFAASAENERILKITIPEELDFEGVFDDLLEKYTDHSELLEVHTTNMGSLYKLHYKVRLAANTKVKEMLDEIRMRNGNLEVSCGKPVSKTGEL